MTIVGILILTPLTVVAPWSSELVVEDYGYYGLIYVLYHYNTSIALAYLIPMVGLIVANKSVKSYFWRVRAETRKYCIICGKSSDYKGKFCTYCGNDLQFSFK